jgi:hypothetical protein
MNIEMIDRADIPVKKHKKAFKDDDVLEID